LRDDRTGHLAEHENNFIFHDNYRIEINQWESGIPGKTLISLVENEFIHPGKSLDLCVGTGKNAFFLVKKGFEVTGIDIWLKSIDYWTETVDGQSSPGTTNQHDLPILPFEDNKFDFIYDLGCFHHVLEMDRSTFIGEIYRVLKKDGTFLLVVLSDKNGIAVNHFSKSDIREYFSNLFEIKLIQHNCQAEAGEEPLYFYTFLMKKI
jgi:ubiquinone/menaquinone biosynthesis C-methylase UbiE